jgi:hypothetical protein
VNARIKDQLAGSRSLLLRCVSSLAASRTFRISIVAHRVLLIYFILQLGEQTPKLRRLIEPQSLFSEELADMEF